MKTVGNLLSSLFKEIGIEDRIKLGSLQQKWKHIFSEPLSSHTYPAELNRSELTVNVDSPAWLQQLKFFKKEMSAKLASYGVKDLKLRHGRIYRVYEKQKSDPKFKSKPLSADDRQWIEETVSEIQDSDLKDQISCAIEKSLR